MNIFAPFNTHSSPSRRALQRMPARSEPASASVMATAAMRRPATMRPRLHLLRFHGVLAPNAKLRPLVVPQGPEMQDQATEAAVAGECELEPVQAMPHRISWARLLKRVFDIDLHTCPNCGGGELKIIATILERPVIEKILTHRGLDPQPPPRGRAREVVQD